jgi:histidyl-tRNA synthetase
MKRRMGMADRASAAFAIIVGDDEIARGVASIKDLEGGAQEEVSLASLADDLIGRLTKMGRGPMEGWTIYAPPSTLPTP